MRTAEPERRHPERTQPAAAGEAADAARRGRGRRLVDDRLVVSDFDGHLLALPLPRPGQEPDESVELLGCQGVAEVLRHHTNLCAEPLTIEHTFD